MPQSGWLKKCPKVKCQPAYKPGFVWPTVTRERDGHSSGTAVAGRLKQPTRATIQRRTQGSRPATQLMSPLFGFAPGGACHAADVAIRAVRSYRTVSPLPAACAAGGLFSVALSLGLPPPDVIRHRVSMEPGLSSA